MTIKQAIEQLRNHGQFYLGDKDFSALEELIDFAEEHEELWKEWDESNDH